MAAGLWGNELHEEIYVFNQGWWNKNHELWVEIQKANWDDVVLKDQFKKNLKKDVFGFFDSETLYKSLAIPWKVNLFLNARFDRCSYEFIARSYHVWSTRSATYIFPKGCILT